MIYILAFDIELVNIYLLRLHNLSDIVKESISVKPNKGSYENKEIAFLYRNIT